MPVTVASLVTPTPFGGVDTTKAVERVYFSVTPAGAYAGAPGDVMDFTALGDLIKSGQPPIFVIMQSAKKTGNTGYFYEYVPNTTLANGFFQVLQCAGAGAPAADIGAGAYPAGVTGDSIIGFADFLRL
jgi:hypothetical protein